MGEWKNRLYFGDNLDILRQDVPSETVDLVYIDPPFNSDATYNLLFKEHNGSASGEALVAIIGCLFLAVYFVGKQQWAIYPGAFTLPVGVVILLAARGLDMDVWWPLSWRRPASVS